MHRFLYRVCLLFLLPLAAIAQPGPKGTQQPNLTIMADSRMLLPLAQLTRVYSEQTNTPITVVLKSRTEAETQILQGIEAHVVITSDEKLVSRLGDQGLTDVNSTTVFARTHLALLAAHNLEGNDRLAPRISFAATLAATPDLPIFTAAASTPEGTRANQLLMGSAFSIILSERLQVLDTRDEVFEEMRDQPSLALMLASDATGKSDVTLLNVLPEEISPPVKYQAVVLASESMDAARQFVTFLHSADAQQILAHFGFQPVD